MVQQGTSLAQAVYLNITDLKTKVTQGFYKFKSTRFNWFYRVFRQ